MSTASLSLLMYVVHLIRLAERSVTALSDRIIVETRIGALEATLQTSNERISALESQIASNDMDMVPKMAQVDSLEGRLRIAEEGALLLSAPICELGLQLSVAQVARSSAEAALHSAESQIQVVCTFESSLQEEVGQLLSDNICAEE